MLKKRRMGTRHPIGRPADWTSPPFQGGDPWMRSIGGALFLIRDTRALLHDHKQWRVAVAQAPDLLHRAATQFPPQLQGEIMRLALDVTDWLWSRSEKPTLRQFHRRGVILWRALWNLIDVALSARERGHIESETGPATAPQWSTPLQKKQIAGALNITIRKLNDLITDGTYAINPRSRKTCLFDLSKVAPEVRKRLTQ